MKSLVFTVTRRSGGLDVTEWALNNLSGHDSDIVWVIGDDLYGRRKGLIQEINERNDFHVMGFDTNLFREQRPELYRTVAHAYNYAIELALQLDCEMFVSLQDYIVPPSNGIERFEKMLSAFPHSIYSGLCSFSKWPSRVDVTNPEGLYTVFDKPFDGFTKWQGFSWDDVRKNNGMTYCERPPVEWEANWSAMPRQALENLDLRYNGDYDIGVAYENQGYSFLAEQQGFPTVIDMENHAISLDHKSFFPQDEVRDIEHSNLEFHNELWNRD